MKRQVIILAVLASAILGAAVSASVQVKKPSILVNFGDDIGWYNSSTYNQGVMGYRTPVVKSLSDAPRPRSLDFPPRVYRLVLPSLRQRLGCLALPPVLRMHKEFSLKEAVNESSKINSGRVSLHYPVADLQECRRSNRVL